MVPSLVLTEKKARMGRPPIAPDLKLYSVRLSASLMAKVDKYAARKGITRSEAMRVLLAKSLGGGR